MDTDDQEITEKSVSIRDHPWPFCRFGFSAYWLVDQVDVNWGQ
jgi:hypothetical protein